MTVLLVLCIAIAGALAWLWLRKPRSTLHRTPPPGERGVLREARPAIDTGREEVVEVAAGDAGAGDAVAVGLQPEALRHFHLARLESLDVAAISRVASICAAMPAPHPIHRMMATGLDTPEELKEAVTADAGLTASILRTVNSAAFALASPITSVQYAITYLGVTMVKGIVARAALSAGAEAVSPEQGEALERIWKSAFFASAFAQLLGQELGLARPSVLSTRSLFFNLGDVALLSGVDGARQWYEDGVSLVERIEAQQAACGANTAIVGSELASLWNLPAELADSIEKGYLPLATPPADHPMDGEELQQNIVVYLSGRIGDQLAYFGLRDIGDLDLDGSDNPSLFYLPTYLEAAGLARVPAILRDPTFRRKANRLASTLAT